MFVVAHGYSIGTAKPTNWMRLAVLMRMRLIAVSICGFDLDDALVFH